KQKMGGPNQHQKSDQADPEQDAHQVLVPAADRLESDHDEHLDRDQVERDGAIGETWPTNQPHEAEPEGDRHQHRDHLQSHGKRPITAHRMAARVRGSRRLSISDRVLSGSRASKAWTNRYLRSAETPSATDPGVKVTRLASKVVWESDNSPTWIAKIPGRKRKRGRTTCSVTCQ